MDDKPRGPFDRLLHTLGIKPRWDFLRWHRGQEERLDRVEADIEEIKERIGSMDISIEVKARRPL